MTTQPHTPDDRVVIAVPIEDVETLAKILIQFETHVDVTKIDFEFDRDQWHHLAIDLLKARAVCNAARTGIHTAIAHRADLFVDAAGKAVVAEAERHLKAVTDQ
jgi:hypothetical protein